MSVPDFECRLKKYRLLKDLTQEPVSYTHLSVGLIEDRRSKAPTFASNTLGLNGFVI